MTIILAFLIALFPPLADNMDRVMLSDKVFPVCIEEDGNPNGLPCIWDGKYFVTSENYR